MNLLPTSLSTLVPTGPEREYELLRLIAIDSYSPGGEAIVELSGGTLVGGENAGGKTSLLCLVPLFFGGNPSRYTQGSDSFASYYLPRTTSYIIWEYRRRDVTCLAVLYANEQDRYSYMLIRAPYDLSLFSTSDSGEVSLVPCAALRAHLDMSRIIHTRTLAVPEYKDVIQNRGGPRRDKKLRDIAAEYAFTSSNATLEHIDSIAIGSFTRKAEFVDFQRMVVDYLQRGGEDITLSGDYGKVSSWPTQYATYLAVMRKAERMQQAIEIETRLQTIDHELGTMNAKLAALRDHLEQQLAEVRGRERHEQTLHGEAREAHAKRQHENQLQLTADTAAVTSQEKLLATLDRQAEAYEREGLLDWAEKCDQIDGFRKDLQQTMRRLENLLGEQSRLTEHYAALMREETDACARIRERVTEDKDKLHSPYLDRRDKLAESRRQRETTLREEHARNDGDCQTSLGTISVKIGELDAERRNPPADPATVAAFAAKRQALLDARAAKEDAGKDRQRLAATCTETQKAREHALRQHECAAADITTCRAAVAELLAYSTPAEGTLLQHLRQHHPDWTRHIAKVIAPTLLMRTDLSPQVTDAADSMYGLRVTLAEIDGALCANEEELQRALATAKQRLDDALAHEKKASADTTQAQQHWKDAEQALAVSLSAYALKEQAVKTLMAEEAAAERAMNDSISNAREAATAKLALVQRSKAAVEEERKALTAKLNSSLTQAANDHQQAEQALTREFESAKQVLQRQIDDAEARKAAKLTVLNDERDAALSAKGISPEAVRQLETDRDALKLQIADIEHWQPRVVAWRQWCSVEWSQREGEAAELVVLQQRQGKTRACHEEEHARWQAAEADYAKTREQLERKRFALAKEQELAERHLQKLADWPAPAAVTYEQIWTVEALAPRIADLSIERNAEHHKLHDRIHEIRGAFQSGSLTNNPIEQYFSLIRSRLAADEGNPRAWVVPLKEWFQSRHNEYRSALLTEARAIGALVQDFHHRLQDFTRRVGNLNGDLKKSLTEITDFPHISGVEIHLKTTVDELTYWKPLNSFVEQHRDWIGSLGNSEPPATFAEGIQALMKHWEVRQGIRAEPRALLEISGVAVENGKRKSFTNGKDLAKLSSNGLSYLILCTIYVAFLRMIRGNAPVHITWAVDELLDLDLRNIAGFVDMLKRNNISLITACPSPDPDVMQHFATRYRVRQGESGPELFSVQLASLADV